MGEWVSWRVNKQEKEEDKSFEADSLERVVRGVWVMQRRQHGSLGYARKTGKERKIVGYRRIVRARLVSET